MCKEAINYSLFKEKLLAVDLFTWNVLDSEFEYLYDLEDEEHELEVERLMREDSERYHFHEHYLDRDEILDDKVLILKNQVTLSLNFGQFLHGFCDTFAVALAKRFGYDIIAAYCWDWSTGKYSYLVHAYCVDEQGNYIDIRGILPRDSNLAMLEEFEEYGAENVTYERLSLGEAIKFFNRFITPSSNEANISKAANLILDLFPEKYSINS